MTNNIPYPFDAETWEKLPGFFEKLPQTVHLHVWGIEGASDGERETAVLCRTLADNFERIHYKQFSRRKNYSYYPVIGIKGEVDGRPHDYGVRIIGWPRGVQLTTLITGIQVVAFQGQTLEPATRIRLRQLKDPVNIELITAVDDEAGAVMAKITFGLAVAHEQIRTFVVVGDDFPEAYFTYSVNQLPHMTINKRVHLEGVVEEGVVLQHLATAVKTAT